MKTKTTRTEAEELYNFAASLLPRGQKLDYAVRIDNHNPKETAFIDFTAKEIVLTNQLIPEDLRKYARFTRRMFDAETMHELIAHYIGTRPHLKTWEEWITKGAQNIAQGELRHTIYNIVEDYRGNFIAVRRYSFDLAARMKVLFQVVGSTWWAQIRPQLNPPLETPVEKEKWHAENPSLEFSLFSLLALYGDFFDSAEARKLIAARPKVQEGLKLIEQLKYLSFIHDVIAIADRLYYLFRYCSVSSIPKNLGGSMVLGKSSGEAKKTAKEVEAKEKAIEAAEDQQKEKQQQGAGRGRGTGLEIPAPEPDAVQYALMVQELKPEIQALLKQLKRLVKISIERRQFTNTGRIMHKQIGKFYAESMRAPVRNMYERRTTQYGKVRTKMLMLYDLSGSVDQIEVRRCLTVLSEACSQYLANEDLAILIFASEYLKIKTFYESYDKTRARIAGDFDRAGCGTEIIPPTKEALKLLAAARGDFEKVLIIVSDFRIDNDTEPFKALIQEAAARQIRPILINLQGFGVEIPGASRIDIDSVRDLIRVFFDIYRAAIGGR